MAATHHIRFPLIPLHLLRAGSQLLPRLSFRARQHSGVSSHFIRHGDLVSCVLHLRSGRGRWGVEAGIERGVLPRDLYVIAHASESSSSS